MQVKEIVQQRNFNILLTEPELKWLLRIVEELDKTDLTKDVINSISYALNPPTNKE